ncbi:MurR/RpiR family transcriptional regulator [Lactonifactor longoviformis]|uniref:Transcriptional regulator, RpiR family n=1 Tax=Lactonifactor longoviformis DSM 17459 TaxID=1122155 RepID=A0A1M5CAA1_9CLOT|nr:MurR/RpiR family transcriptional regulator [Lactonifactor longoviformis]POP34621.1 MurR/RpiR family transcriptional regulator [Lactonifactor longoviformis]SHF51527.1 transcriptional regulator, RpiR family [Lactonifactor longoviformis DSM 17459]
MDQYEKTIIPLIESMYNSFTPIEKTIADFFIHNTQTIDFSSKNISRQLYVSEASLSRFAKKCGFKGYREFLFRYQQGFGENQPVITDDSAKQVLNTYQELLTKSYALLDEQQLDRIVHILSTKKRVYVYGRGSSGLVAQEMKLRFMRIGVNMESITDSHIMKMNSVLLDEDCAVIAISISGRTQEVMTSLRAAKTRGATTILMTSRREKEFQEFCDEILLFAVKEHLENGKAISPQFPILIMVDIFYSRFMELDTFHKEALHDYTMDILYGGR